LAARSPLKTAHHTTPAPTFLPDELLLSRFVLVCHDGAQPLYLALCDGPFLVLERSLHSFKLQIGSRQDTGSTHRLKLCHAPQDVQAAKPPRRGWLPGTAVPSPPVKILSSCFASKGSQSALKSSRHVTFACPAASDASPPTASEPPSPSPAVRSRPVRSTKQLVCYTR